MSRRAKNHRRSRSLHDLDSADAEVSLGSGGNTSLRLANGDPQFGQVNAAGQLEGFGVYYWARSKDVYRGHFKEGLMDGRGTYTFGKTGDRFCGEWKDGQIHGGGKMMRLDGSVTEGKFIDGKANGWCHRTYTSTDDVYEGLCRNDVREGFGIYLWARGERRYEGPWKDDCMHGPLGLWTTEHPVMDHTGRLLRPSAGAIASAIAAAPRVKDDLSFCSSYLGRFERDLRHGEGTCQFLDGFKYSGEWQRHFSGTYSKGSVALIMTATFTPGSSRTARDLAKDYCRPLNKMLTPVTYFPTSRPRTKTQNHFWTNSWLFVVDCCQARCVWTRP